ncbi:MAG TPA: hypothetical protein VN939_06525 [Chthoniobacterales bacterium]|nr:hypothetical protein [Chthoniobacterales bacterium]
MAQLSLVRCVIVVLGGGLLFLWFLGALQRSELVYQDKLMYVEANDWVVGQNKICTSRNVDLGRQTLACDVAEGKAFEVRFYGETHRDNKPVPTLFRWECVRDSSAEPSITCKAL